MNWFFESNTPAARVMRTIVQGVIGAVIAWLTVISGQVPEIVSMLVIPVTMAVLSPIMGWIGEKNQTVEDYKIGGSE